MTEYSVVIPAYNEEARITSGLTQVTKFMNSFTSSYEVIVVDDGSVDNTIQAVENYVASEPSHHIKLIKNPHKGKGYTVRTGVLEALGEYILIADADMSTPIEELKRLQVWTKEHNFDVVIASREGVGATRHKEPYYRHLMGRVFNLFVRVTLLPGIHDSQCGFKLFKKNAAYDIFRNLVLFGEDVPEIKQPRVSAFDVEVLVIAKRKGYKIKAVPVEWVYDAGTKVNPIRDSLANFNDVLKVKINDIKGRYS